MAEPENIPSSVPQSTVDYYNQSKKYINDIINSSSAIPEFENFINNLGPLPTATNNVELDPYCELAVSSSQELQKNYYSSSGASNDYFKLSQELRNFMTTLLQNYRPAVSTIRNAISQPVPEPVIQETVLEPVPEPVPVPEPGVMNYTSSLVSIPDAPMGPKPDVPKKPVAAECFPTYGKNSPPVCAPDTTGRCIGSGLMNMTGFPPCCNENVDESCIVTPSNPYMPPITPSGSAPVPPPLVNPSVYSPNRPSAPSPPSPPAQPENLSGAAAGCVAKNPNYPAPVGGCVYNPSNPCPTKYETTDTRFGTKMCCAPQTTENANCFSSKSTFGSSNNYCYIYIIFLVIAILLFIFMKKK